MKLVTRVPILMLPLSLMMIYAFLPAITQIAHADFNFDAAGDWGCNSNTKSSVTNIQAKKPERVLGLGDYSYTPTATCWLDIINPIKSITRINIGNHENDADEGNAQYKSAFGLGNQYYSFNYVNAHVLTMATEISYSKGSAQYTFVENDLKTAAADPNIKWIIVNYHKPMYTSPNTCSSCDPLSSLRDTYHPLFDKYKVDIVLQGHVHNYQRTYPIKYDSVSPSSPTRTSTSASSYNDPEGEIFATVGSGGVNFHGLSGKSSFVASQQSSKFGVLDVLMADDGSKLTGRFYANGASFPSDTFTISKPVTLSSLAKSRTTQVDPIVTGNDSQVVNGGEPVASKDRNIPHLPDLSEIIYRTKKSLDTPTRLLNNTINENSVPGNRQKAPSEPEKPETAVVRNIPPIANIGKNQIALAGSEIILDGSGSKDKDGKILSYQWLQLRGPKVDIDGADKTKAKFVIQNIESYQILAFKLIVTDDRGGSDSAVTTVRVKGDNGDVPLQLPHASNEPSLLPFRSSGTLENLVDSFKRGNFTNSSAN